MGFELNLYDMCVANKTIDGKQCTLVWYVDDTKILHVDGNVVSHVDRISYNIEGDGGKMGTRVIQ